MFDCDWLIIPYGAGAPPINEKEVALQKAQAAAEHGNRMLQQLGINGVDFGQNAGYTGNCVTSYAGPEENDVYWYHPDHLGSSSFITGIDGEVTQNIEYFPSGETFVENHLNSYNTPYLYNSKELDDETGYYYYGARYYNPRVSLWLNVDPLAEDYPSWSPYSYTFNNPVRFIDPDGMEPGPGPMWNYYNILQGGSLRFTRKTTPDAWSINTFFGTVNLPNPGATNFHILQVGFDEMIFTSHKQMAIYANAIDWDYFNETHHLKFNETSVYQGKTYKIGKTPPTLSQIRDNVAALQELSCNCGAVMMGAMSAVSTSNVTSRLQSYVNRAAKEVDALGDAAFTPKQLRAIQKNPNLREMYRGNRIDVRARGYIKNDPSLNHLKSNYTNGPDFVDPKTGNWWDMTTPAQWRKHVSKYGSGGTLLKTK